MRAASQTVFFSLMAYGVRFEVKGDEFALKERIC